MSRVFLDANLLFSAAISPGGVARAIFDLARRHEIIVLFVSGYAVEEALGNLQRKQAGQVSELLSLLDGIGYVEPPPARLVERLKDSVADPNDLPILAGAIWAEADLLVTGDRKHFGELYGKYVGGCLVMKPRDALGLMLAEVEEAT